MDGDRYYADRGRSLRVVGGNKQGEIAGSRDRQQAKVICISREHKSYPASPEPPPETDYEPPPGA